VTAGVRSGIGFSRSIRQKQNVASIATPESHTRMDSHNEMMAVMKASLEKMKAYQEKVQTKMEVCPVRMEANHEELETNLEETEAVTEPQEVSNEEAAMETIRSLKDRSGHQ
jgi:hypothetical protein